MADQFIYCPDCGSDKIVDPNYDEDGEGEKLGPECECEACGWEGDQQELVCAPEPEDLGGYPDPKFERHSQSRSK